VENSHYFSGIIDSQLQSPGRGVAPLCSQVGGGAASWVVEVGMSGIKNNVLKSKLKYLVKPCTLQFEAQFEYHSGEFLAWAK
jgi:hypothetical protein